MTDKPPLTVTGMRWAVLILATWNLLRAGFAIANWTALLEFAPRPGPFYVALTGSFWTLACLAVFIAIRRRYARSQRVYAIVLYAYAAWWWADRLFFSQQPRPNGLFAAAVTALLLAFVAADFFNKNATEYFTLRETNDQPTNQPTP
ncbi:MAG: hypothetical protein AB1750_17410 [Chloroflexota bacterium]